MLGRKQIAIGVTFTALMALTIAALGNLTAQASIKPHVLRAQAPNMIGTGTTASVGSTQAAYPIGAVNSSDIWGANGPTTYKTASLAGLVANTPVAIVAAVAGKQIVVVGYDLSSNVAGSTVVFQDETAVTPVVYDGCTFAANDHIQVSRGGAPVFIMASGAALDIAITGTVDVVKGSVTYYLQ